MANFKNTLCILLSVNFPLHGNSVYVLFKSSKKVSNFLSKLWYSHQVSRRNIFSPLCLKSETSEHVQLAIALLYILLANIWTWYLMETSIKDMVSLITRWLHWCGCVTFPGTSYNVCSFLVEMSTFTKSMELTFGGNKFVKRTVQSLHTRIQFSSDQVR